MGLRSICQDPAKSHPARPWFHELFGFALAAAQTCHPFEINGVALMCSLTVPAGLLETLIGKAAIGDIEWNRGGRQFRASCWTVPMKYELQVPGWVVLVTIPGKANRIDQRVTAVVYSNNYASVGLSMLLAIFRIRTRLVCRPSCLAKLIAEIETDQLTAVEKIRQRPRA